MQIPGQQLMVMLTRGSTQEQSRNVHMSGVADRAGSVANALNLNAGVVVGVVARMVAAKNEKQKHIFIQTGLRGDHDRSKRAMFTTSGLATADA